MELERSKTLKGRRKVEAEILSWIRQNKPLPGEKFFSQREVAQIVGVDPMTANKAIKELTRQGILYSEHGKGTFIGPGPGQNTCRRYAMVIPAMNLEDKKTNPDSWHIVNKIYSAFMSALKENEIFSNVIIAPEKTQVPPVFRQKEYDAVFFAGEKEFSGLISNLIDSQETQVVIIGSADSCQLKCMQLNPALAESVYKGISYIAEAGYRKIAYIGSAKMTEKFEGYKKVLSAYGLPLNMNNVVLGVEAQDDGAKGASILLGKTHDFDAIFVDTDQKAAGAIAYLASQGINVPEDAGVMGFDGLDEFINAPHFLTTVRTNFDKLVGEALDTLRNKKSNVYLEQKIEIPGTVIPNRTLSRKIS